MLTVIILLKTDSSLNWELHLNIKTKNSGLKASDNVSSAYSLSIKTKINKWPVSAHGIKTLMTIGHPNMLALDYFVYNWQYHFFMTGLT